MVPGLPHCPQPPTGPPSLCHGPQPPPWPQPPPVYRSKCLKYAKIASQVILGPVLLRPLYLTWMLSNSQEAIQMVLKALRSILEIINYS